MCDMPLSFLTNNQKSVNDYSKPRAEHAKYTLAWFTMVDIARFDLLKDNIRKSLYIFLILCFAVDSQDVFCATRSYMCSASFDVIREEF